MAIKLGIEKILLVPNSAAQLKYAVQTIAKHKLENTIVLPNFLGPTSKTYAYDPVRDLITGGTNNRYFGIGRNHGVDLDVTNGAVNNGVMQLLHSRKGNSKTVSSFIKEHIDSNWVFFDGSGYASQKPSKHFTEFVEQISPDQSELGLIYEADILAVAPSFPVSARRRPPLSNPDFFSELWLDLFGKKFIPFEKIKREKFFAKISDFGENYRYLRGIDS